MAATLAEALAEFQADPPVLTRNKDGQAGNHKTKYADLAQVNEKVLARLSQLGVIYTTAPTLLDDGKFVLEYELEHVASKTKAGGRYPLKLSENPQQMGSAITYARRYALLAMTGVAAEDEDDDGQAGSGRRTAQRAARPPQDLAQNRKTPPAATAQRAAARPPLPGDDGITAPQRAKLMAVLGQIGVHDRDARLNLSSQIVGRQLGSANDLTKGEASALIDTLEKASQEDDPAAYLGELLAGEPS